jgi:hypothetical protein
MDPKILSSGSTLAFELPGHLEYPLGEAPEQHWKVPRTIFAVCPGLSNLPSVSNKKAVKP